MTDEWSPEDGAGYIPTEEGGSEPTTDDESDDYEREWEDLDEKVILAQILTELTQIRMLLSDADTGASRDTDRVQQYECNHCEWTGVAGDRRRHAESEHKVPPGEWEGMFTEVNE